MFFEATGAAGAVERLKEAFSKLGGALKQVYDALAGLKPVWEVLFNVISAFAGIVIGAIGSVLSVVADLVSGIVTAIAFIISKASEFID
jgi:phage-related protein